MSRDDKATSLHPSLQAEERRWWWSVWLAGVLLLAWNTLPASGQYLVRQVNLAYLTRRADIVVQGRVAEARYEPHPDYPHLSTVRVTLEVEQMLRGPAGRRFSFRELLLGPRPLAGKRGYAAGQRLLLFLPTPSRSGLSSPIAREQGRFRLLRDARGRELIQNEFGNAGLFRGVPEAAAKAGASLTGKRLRIASQGAGPVAAEDFVGLVKTLVALPRSE